METIIISIAGREKFIKELADEIFQRLITLKEFNREDELIQIPESMKILGRSRSTINNWRKEGFLKDQDINTDSILKNLMSSTQVVKHTLE